MGTGDSTDEPFAKRGRPGSEPARRALVTPVEEPTTGTTPVIQTGREEHVLGREAGVGLAWSLANNVVGRLGNFLAGIVVVRLLSQEQYGVFAIGLTVLTVLLSLNELGVSVAIVQHRDRVEDIAPTVMTLAIASSVTVAVAAFLCAPAMADLMGAPEASGLIRLLVAGVVLDGVAAVPNAMLSRRFMQRRRLKIDTIAFVVGTPVTILLAMDGYGAWSLGWGAVVGNVTTALLALIWTPLRVRPGWDADVARQVLRFGLPLAGASLLALLVLNVDYIVVGHQLGPEELGLYLLAFNLCSWPITVVISAVRRVAVALFARLSEHSQALAKEGFTRVIVIVLGVALPMCVLLGGFAGPLISLLYGSRWSPAAVALPMLAVLSFGRVAVEITYDYLAGSGRTRSTIWLHGVWFAALAPALFVGARLDGIHGVAIGHALVALLVVFPTLVVLVGGHGIDWALLRPRALRLVLGGVGMAMTIVAARATFGISTLAMLLGSPTALLLYGACVWPLRRDALLLWNLRTSTPTPSATPTDE